MSLSETLLLTHFVFKLLALLPVVPVIVIELLILSNGLIKLSTSRSPLCVLAEM